MMFNKWLRSYNSLKYSDLILRNLEITSFVPKYFDRYQPTYYAAPENKFIAFRNDLPKMLNIISGNHSIQAPYYFHVDKCKVLNGTPFVIDEYGNIIYEQLGGRLVFPKGMIPNIERIKNKKPSSFFENAVIINSRNSNNYYHWHVDTLLKLQALDHIKGGWQDYNFISTSKLKKWQQDSLELLGIDKSKIYQAEGDITEIKNCLVLSPRRSHIRISSNAISWLTTRITSNIQHHKNSTVKRVFVSRKVDEGRNILNEDKVQNLLNNFGYDKYYLDELSFRDQIALFQNAENIIAVHGAGLVNMIYGNATDVLELFSENVHAFYYTLSSATNSNYNCYQGIPTFSKQTKNNKASFHVDLSELKKLLK